MSDYSASLGNAVYEARMKQKLTQDEAAERAGIGTRTVLNIENRKGNPKMEVLYPLIRALEIDPKAVFYPGLEKSNPASHDLQLLLSTCSVEEAATLLPVCKAVLTALRTGKPMRW